MWGTPLPQECAAKHGRWSSQTLLVCAAPAFLGSRLGCEPLGRWSMPRSMPACGLQLKRAWGPRRLGQLAPCARSQSRSPVVVSAIVD